MRALQESPPKSVTTMNTQAPSPQFDASHGGLSPESTPRIVVRAGKHYVCSACGTWVQLPDDVVGQLVIAADSVEPAEPAAESPAKEEPSLPEAPKPSCRKSPPRIDTGRETIDGLIVPTTEEMQRLLKWIEYRLHRLDALKRLERQLTRQKSSKMPGRPARRQANKVPLRRAVCDTKPTQRSQAHADVGMAPSSDVTHQRGPP